MFNFIKILFYDIQSYMYFPLGSAFDVNTFYCMTEKYAHRWLAENMSRAFEYIAIITSRDLNLEQLSYFPQYLSKIGVVVMTS